MSRAGIAWSALMLVAGCSTLAPQDTISKQPVLVEERSRSSADDGLAANATDLLFSSLAEGADSVWGLESLFHAGGGTLSVTAPLAAEEHGVLTLRAGYESVDSDRGQHDREHGGGGAFGLGYRHYFGWDHAGWLAGGRLDFWVAEIDWRDDLVGGGMLEGTSDVVVLRPALEAGYSLWISHAWRFALFTTLGLDLYLDTDGEDVGNDHLRLSVGFAVRIGF